MALDEYIRRNNRERMVNTRRGLNIFQLASLDFLNFIKKLFRERKMTIWIQSIKNIEGRFGTGVASYFVLARWTFLLNMALALLWVIFVLAEGFWGEFDQMDNSDLTYSSQFHSSTSITTFQDFFTGNVWLYDEIAMLNDR